MNTNVCMRHNVWPSPCRPVAGGINFCPLAMDTVDDDDEIIAIAMHELTHTLVRVPNS